jgi:hypothetical protein
MVEPSVMAEIDVKPNKIPWAMLSWLRFNKPLWCWAIGASTNVA